MSSLMHGLGVCVSTDPLALKKSLGPPTLSQIPDPESQYCKRSDCDTLFITANYQPDKKSAEAQVNNENGLMRYEFLELICRAGIAKYGKGQATDDVATAVGPLRPDSIFLPPR